MEAVFSLAVQQLNPNPHLSQLLCGFKTLSPGNSSPTPFPPSRSWSVEPSSGLWCSATRRHGSIALEGGLIFLWQRFLLLVAVVVGKSGGLACAVTGSCVWQGERGVMRSRPSAHYPLAGGGSGVCCIPLPIQIHAELPALQWELVFPAGELLCAQTKGWGCRCLPLFSSCPGAPASDSKKPLEARLSNGWSGINALQGLCPPCRPFGDGGVPCSPFPRVLCP